MRISKDGVYAEVTDDIAQPLIDTMGWSASSRSVTGARFISPEELDKVAATAAKLAVTGGKPAPPDKDWTATVFVAGTGLVEFRCINGTVQLRGTLKQSVSAVGSFTPVRKFGGGMEAYHPKLTYNTTAFGQDTGTAYRFAAVRLGTDGTIQLSAPTGKYDTVEFDGISWQVF